MPDYTGSLNAPLNAELKTDPTADEQHEKRGLWISIVALLISVPGARRAAALYALRPWR
eukprot:SAG31_NODE_24354_length_483_cov_0.942708_1_plen_59_part_00